MCANIFLKQLNKYPLAGNELQVKCPCLAKNAIWPMTYDAHTVYDSLHGRLCAP